jgi:medium-chain acyl-[acyl-carrier-protein] hydrolase
VNDDAFGRWLVRLRERPGARLRLFCFPYAGAGASIFHRWPDALQDDVEVVPVQLPGRETRYREPLHHSIEPLVAGLAAAIAPALDRPFAFFGYSLGGLVAFETARELRRRGAAQPELLLIAASPAPHCKKAHPPIADLPEAEFLDHVRRVYAPPEAAWRVPELLQLMLPILRADMDIYQRHAPPPEPPISCPIHVFGGEDDHAAPREDLHAWREYTAADFSAQHFAGGHFFIHQQAAPLQRAVAGHLTTLLARLPPRGRS